MKIEDLIELLNNRLREFQLSRDYAKMSGDLGRMNIADKEIIALEDTLFKLNLLIDTSKSAAVKEEILAEVITDGSVAVLGEYDISPYATDPLHEEKIMNILSNMGVMDTAEKIDKYIKSKSLGSPVTGEMIMSAALAYEVDTRLMMAIMEQDSRFGTLGVAVRTLNPGNVGNDDDGNTRTYDSWQEGVTAVAEWLSRHRVSEEFPEETVFDLTATSTPPIITPTTATTTPIITISTTTTATTTPVIATTTPAMATSTPTTTTTTTASTSSPQAASSSFSPITPTTVTPTPVTASSSEETIPVVTSTTTTATTSVTASSSEETATSTSSQPSPEATAGTAGQADSTAN